MNSHGFIAKTLKTHKTSMENKTKNKTEKQLPASNLALFLSYFKPHKALFIADMIFAVFVAAVDVAFPVVSRWTINTLLPRYNDFPEKTLKIFIWVIVLCVIAYILHTLANVFVTYFGHMFGVHVVTDMRRDIFRHIQNQSFAFFDSNRTGKIMSRITTDLFEISEMAHHGPEDLFISLLTLIGSFVIMLSVRWQMALIIFVVFPSLLFAMLLSRKAMIDTSRRVKATTAQINSDIESAISGIRVTKAFANEEFEQKKFDESNLRYFNSKSLYYRAMAVFLSRKDFLSSIMGVVVLAAGGYFVMKGEMSLGDLVAANLFVVAFLQPVKRLTGLVEQFSTGIAGFLRFAEIMRTDNSTFEKSDAEEIKSVKGDIEFKNVDFSYIAEVPVLKNFSLSVKAGETVALVGSSGSGKTTICNLLPRFYDASAGTIEIDGRDTRDFTLSSLRKQIGIVQQDVFLFAGTIRENIAYGSPDATEEQIIDAARKAEILEDIESLPDGLSTIVGERGIKLSGGQKQRISIARIFLKNPPILILDEATSALDSATEAKIQKSFEALSKGRTTFTIAHRLSTIRNATKIAVISEDGIAEIGTHEELCEKGGIYASLLKAQKA